MSKEQPRVFIGIPTGPPKKYALAYMFAALQNLDWDNKEIHFAVTQYKFKDDDGFSDYLRKLIDTIDVGGPVYVHWTYLNEIEARTPYLAVLRNKAVLRAAFLDGDCEYFLMLGGDNPPPRATIKRLMKLNADIASGIVYQRPKRGFGTASGGLPLLWRSAWYLHELDKYDLPPEIMDEFRTAFIESSFLIPIILDPNWRRRKTIEGIAGGDGCVLIRRKVLEYIGWYLPKTGYHSEDVNFFTNAMARGFTTKADLKLHVPHFDPDGSVY